MLNRLEDAETQFIAALALTPTFLVSKYNLALTYQQMGRWADAVEVYQEINSVALNRRQTIKPEDELTGTKGVYMYILHV